MLPTSAWPTYAFIRRTLSTIPTEPRSRSGSRLGSRSGPGSGSGLGERQWAGERQRAGERQLDGKVL